MDWRADPAMSAAGPDAPVVPLHGLVLAGGRSVRLGRDKAAIRFDGRTLLARCVELLQPLVEDLRVAVRADQVDEPLRRRFPLLVDARSDIGPAAGVLAAHSFAPRAAWLVLACDMPQLTSTMLRRLIARRDPVRGATAFRAAADGRPEPLCAIYEPATLGRLQVRVDAGGSSGLRELLVVVNPVLLDAPGADALASINTPEDCGRMLPPHCPGGMGSE